MKLPSKLSVVAVVAVWLARSAGAGMLDSPPPVLPSGAQAQVVYRMGPVNYDDLGTDTIVTCTNLADTPADIALEIFDDEDHVVGTTVRQTVAPAAAVAFATSAGAEEPNATVLAALPQVDDGKARVSSSTAQLACSALHRFRAVDGRTKEAPLELVKKVGLGN